MTYVIALAFAVIVISCSDNTNNVTGRDSTKNKSYKDIKQDRTIVPTEKEVKKEEVIPEKEPTKESETVSMVLDGNESFWWVVVEFGDMKGNTLVMQDHPYLDFDELKAEMKKSFKKPKENPFILNFIQISRETFIHNATKK